MWEFHLHPLLTDLWTAPLLKNRYSNALLVHTDITARLLAKQHMGTRYSNESFCYPDETSIVTHLLINLPRRRAVKRQGQKLSSRREMPIPWRRRKSPTVEINSF